MSGSGREATVAEIGRLRFSAILRTDATEAAARAMEAAVRGGFRLVEFTLTIPGALELVSEFSKRDGLVVGAGTVLTVEDARAAVRAGARFLVSPIVDPAVIAEARALDVASIPGCATPTEMMTAHRAGADIVKVFPEPGQLAAFVRQVRGPLPFLKLFPTAGITPENFIDVMRAGTFGVGFVASLFTPQDLAAGNVTGIESRARMIHERSRVLGG